MDYQKFPKQECCPKTRASVFCVNNIFAFLFVCSIIGIGISAGIYNDRINSFTGIKGKVTNSTNFNSTVQLNSTFFCIVHSYYPINTELKVTIINSNTCNIFNCNNVCNTTDPLIALICMLVLFVLNITFFVWFHRKKSAPQEIFSYGTTYETW